jgi:hypothetical protein
MIAFYILNELYIKNKKLSHLTIQYSQTPFKVVEYQAPDPISIRLVVLGGGNEPVDKGFVSSTDFSGLHDSFDWREKGVATDVKMQVQFLLDWRGKLGN